MIARMIKGARKRQSITEPTDQEEPTDQQEAKQQAAPSTGGRVIRIRFNLGLNTSRSFNDKHEVDIPIPPLPEAWWASYYRRRGSDYAPTRIISRSDKHDYRNPESNYPEDIVDVLRIRSLMTKDAEELDLQQRLNPFLSQDFLKTLQRFGLFPSPEDDDEEGGGDEEEKEGPNDEIKNDDVDFVQLRPRTPSDASCVRSRATSARSIKSDGKPAEITRRGSLSVEGMKVTPSPVLRQRIRLQKRIRRWTITSVSSLRSFHRWRAVW